MHKLIFLDNTGNCVLNSKSLFERLFLPEKETNYKTSTIVSHKLEFLMVVITTEHVAFSDNIQHFL